MSNIVLPASAIDAPASEASYRKQSHLSLQSRLKRGLAAAQVAVVLRESQALSDYLMNYGDSLNKIPIRSLAHVQSPVAESDQDSSFLKTATSSPMPM